MYSGSLARKTLFNDYNAQYCKIYSAESHYHKIGQHQMLHQEIPYPLSCANDTKPTTSRKPTIER